MKKNFKDYLENVNSYSVYKKMNDMISDSDRFLKQHLEYKEKLNKLVKILKSKLILAKHLFRLDFADFPIITVTGNYADFQDYKYCYEEIKSLLPKALAAEPMLIDIHINDI